MSDGKQAVGAEREWLDAQHIVDRSDDKTWYSISADKIAGLLKAYAAQIATHSAAPKCPTCRSEAPLSFVGESVSTIESGPVQLVKCSDPFHAEGHSAAESRQHHCFSCGSENPAVRLGMLIRIPGWQNADEKRTARGFAQQLENDMDATALKLVQRLSELDEQQNRILRERTAILTALEVAGVKPKGQAKGFPGSQETNYEVNQTFRGRSLPAACEIVLKDHKGQWLTKSEIEYLIVQGGYGFATGNPKNSIGVTLQRMAEERLCEVERVRGQQGNRYRWPLPSEEVKKK